MDGVKYPFGKAEVQSIAPAATIAVTVSDQLSYVKINAVLTAATTINITPSGVANGAQLFVEIPCTTAYDVTFGSTFVTSAGVTGTANKTKVASFIYVNGKYVQNAVNTIN